MPTPPDLVNEGQAFDRIDAILASLEPAAMRRVLGHLVEKWGPLRHRMRQALRQTQIDAASSAALNANGTEARSSLLASFELFWSVYPKKRNKLQAEAVWLKLKPDQVLAEQIRSSAVAWSSTHEWQKENCKFVPYAERWLRQRRWTEAPDAASTQAPLVRQGNADAVREFVKRGGGP
jgi:hypothetical protein